jgi:hypothetical protein
MRRLALAFALPLLLAACGKKDAPSGGGTMSGSASDVAEAKAKAGTVNGRCPVLVDQLVDPEPRTVDYKDPVSGKTVKVGFCCEKCPPKFEKDPERYMKIMRADPANFGYAP